jgi:hypothetical protein
MIIIALSVVGDFLFFSYSGSSLAQTIFLSSIIVAVVSFNKFI